MYGSSKDIDYLELFHYSSDLKDEKQSYTYNTFINDVYNLRKSFSFYKFFEEYLVTKIFDLVKLKDESFLFRIEEQVINDKFSSIKDSNMLINIRTIIENANNKLEFENQKSLQNKETFISYEKFETKMKEMNQKNFLFDYLNHINNIRFAGRGLKKLHEIYDFDTNNHLRKYQSMMYIFAFCIVIGIIELLRYIITYLYKYNTTLDVDTNRDENKTYFKLKDRSSYIVKYKYDAEIFKLDKDFAADVRNRLGDKFVLFSILITIYLMVIAYLYNWIRKSNTVYNFNKLMSESNGDYIVRESNNLFMYYYESIYNDHGFLSSNKHTLYSSENLLYNNLLDSCLVKDDLIGITIENSDMKNQYESLKNIVSSYDKCNYLINSKIDTIPFPITTFTIYLIIIILSTIILVYLFLVIRPIERFQDIKLIVYIKDRLKNGLHVSSHDYNNIKTELEHKYANIIAKCITASCILVISTILFYLIIINTNRFETSIYVSNLFLENQCYIE